MWVGQPAVQGARQHVGHEERCGQQAVRPSRPRCCRRNRRMPGLDGGEDVAIGYQEIDRQQTAHGAPRSGRGWSTARDS